MKCKNELQKWTSKSELQMNFKIGCLNLSFVVITENYGTKIKSCAPAKNNICRDIPLYSDKCDSISPYQLYHRLLRVIQVLVASKKADD